MKIPLEEYDGMSTYLKLNCDSTLPGCEKPEGDHAHSVFFTSPILRFMAEALALHNRGNKQNRIFKILVRKGLNV